jgi:His/Glu/Gln/Arg/opine family amino acid ABC transporter permease subunit
MTVDDVARLQARSAAGDVPVRRRRRVGAAVGQVLIVAATVALLAWLAVAVRAGLARNGIGFDLGFLGQPANFEISEGETIGLDGLHRFVAADSNAQALIVGFLNTVKVSILSIVLATVLGVSIGIGRVSRNWLVRQLTFVIVEFVRNTPMLIQLVFWYFAVLLKLPGLTEASRWFGGFIASQQGLYIPGLVAAHGASLAAVWALLAGVVFAVGALGSPTSRRWYAAISAIGFVLAAVIGFPVAISTPQVDGFAVTGGYGLSPEFAALLLGLSVYTAAFIAEIVRGAILSLPRGQWEAAEALGFDRRTTFRDIVVPQVFRVVLPAFGNQYISLAKSTSLGIAIGYSDLFNVYGTVANQSGLSAAQLGHQRAREPRQQQADEGRGGAMTSAASAIRWCRRNLFATPGDAALSLLFIPLCMGCLAALVDWATGAAQWSVVAENLRVLMVGRYPSDMMWRPWCSALILAALFGLTLGLVVQPRTGRGLFGLPLSGRFVATLWLVGLVAIAVVLAPAGLDRWGGLLMSALFTLLASVLSIPIGIALALGRQSRYFSARLLCTAYIEVMRSLPLILVVYCIWIVLPLLVPGRPGPDFLRGLIGFTLFFAAYVAEYVRSGLQSIPRGQIEAAQSLGMGSAQISRDVVLPQAVRVVMPALVGNVLDIFNTVPLLFIIGMTDFLRAGQMILINPQSGGRTYEVYAFMFVVYWLIASAITYAARRLEARMALGHR